MNFMGLIDKSMGEITPTVAKMTQRHLCQQSLPLHGCLNAGASCTICRRLNMLKSICFRQLSSSKPLRGSSDGLIIYIGGGA